MNGSGAEMFLPKFGHGSICCGGNVVSVHCRRCQRLVGEGSGNSEVGGIARAGVPPDEDASRELTGVWTAGVGMLSLDETASGGLAGFWTAGVGMLSLDEHASGGMTGFWTAGAGMLSLDEFEVGAGVCWWGGKKVLLGYVL